MTTAEANRYCPPDPEYRLPVEPPHGIGIVYESCTRRRYPIELPVMVTRLLRQGSLIDLCWQCGPEGSVYHLAGDTTMADVVGAGLRQIAESRYWEDATTPEALAEFDRKMRRAFGMEA